MLPSELLPQEIDKLIQQLSATRVISVPYYPHDPGGGLAYHPWGTEDIGEEFDEPEIQKAMAALVLIGRDAVLPLCHALNKGGDDSLSARIATALSNIGDNRAVPALCAGLDKCKYGGDTANALARALGTFGDQCALSSLWGVYKRARQVDSIIEAMARIIVDPVLSLEEEEWVVRAAGTAILGGRKNDAAIPHLIRVLTGDSHTDVRTGAAVALIRIKKDELVKLDALAVSPLCDILESPDFFSFAVREAIAVLGMIGGAPALEALRRAVKNPTDWVAATALQKLAAIGEADLASLSYAARRSELVALVAIGNLARVGQAGFGPLCDSLQHQSERVASAAAEVLAPFGDASVPFLGEALTHWRPRDADPVSRAMPLVIELERVHERVALAVVRSLARGGEQAVPFLRSAVNHPSGSVAVAALEALIRRDDTNIPTLAVALQHPSERVAFAALEALAGKGDQAILPVSRALSYPDYSVPALVSERAAAILDAKEDAALAKALVEIDEPSVLSLCNVVASGSSPRVMRTASRLLVQLPSENAALAGAVLSKTNYKTGRSEAIGDVLVGIAGPSVAPLCVLLTSTSELEVIWAARILYRIGDARAVPDLSLALSRLTAPTDRRVHHNPDVVRQVAESLVRLGESDAVTPLFRALRRPSESRWINAGCLALALSKAGKAALPALCSLLTDPSWHVRDAAAKGLEQLANSAPSAALNGAVSQLRLNSLQRYFVNRSSFRTHKNAIGAIRAATSQERSRQILGL